jgi:HSP20 family protein
MYQVELRPFKNPSLSLWEKEVEKIFDGLHKTYAYSPVCEMVEADQYYLISLDVPGLSKHEIEVEVKDSQLFITGERKVRHYGEKDRVLRTEKRFGKFSRVFTIPQNVNVDGIEARFENGVLDLTLPKQDKAVSKKITISELRN